MTTLLTNVKVKLIFAPNPGEKQEEWLCWLDGLKFNFNVSVSASTSLFPVITVRITFFSFSSDKRLNGWLYPYPFSFDCGLISKSNARQMSFLSFVLFVWVELWADRCLRAEPEGPNPLRSNIELQVEERCVTDICAYPCVTSIVESNRYPVNDKSDVRQSPFSCSLSVRSVIDYSKDYVTSFRISIGAKYLGQSSVCHFSSCPPKRRDRCVNPRLSRMILFN